MRKILALGISSLFLAFIAANSALADDTTQEVDQLRTDLSSSGISDSDISAVEAPARDMLDRGATRDEVISNIVGFAQAGLTGSDLVRTVQTLDDLQKQGKSPAEAGSIVSGQIHDAQNQGLAGSAIADKVQGAVQGSTEEASKPPETQEKSAEKGGIISDMSGSR